MTNLAQPIAAQRPEQHEARASDSDLLKLTGNTPTTVYVKVTPRMDQAVGERAHDTAWLSQDQKTWYKGMKWKHGDEYALYITYSLVTSGIELVPSKKPLQLWFSPVESGTQQGCIPPVSGTYHFRVKLPATEGTAERYIDPQIVVTPL